MRGVDWLEKHLNPVLFDCICQNRHHFLPRPFFRHAVFIHNQCTVFGIIHAMHPEVFHKSQHLFRIFCHLPGWNQHIVRMEQNGRHVVLFLKPLFLEPVVYHCIRPVELFYVIKDKHIFLVIRLEFFRLRYSLDKARHFQHHIIHLLNLYLIHARIFKGYQHPAVAFVPIIPVSHEVVEGTRIKKPGLPVNISLWIFKLKE